MRKTKKVLRLRFELGFGQRQISRCCGKGLGTVHEYLERATAAGIGWAMIRWNPTARRRKSQIGVYTLQNKMRRLSITKADYCP
jgi:hypothetical protein